MKPTICGENLHVSGWFWAHDFIKAKVPASLGGKEPTIASCVSVSFIAAIPCLLSLLIPSALDTEYTQSLPPNTKPFQILKSRVRLHTEI